MKFLRRIGCILLAGGIYGAAFADPPLHATRNETVTIAGKYRSAFFQDPVREESWLWPLRTVCFFDAVQSTEAMTQNRWVDSKEFGRVNLGHEFIETDPLYRGLSDWERGPAIMAVGWLAERAITGIRDRKLRDLVGWLAVAVESYVVFENGQNGTRIFGFKF